MARPQTLFDFADLTNPLLLYAPVDQELLRRCATVHVCEPVVFEAVLHSGLEGAMSFEKLAALHFVERLPGPEYRWQLRDSARTEIFETWWSDSLQGGSPGNIEAIPPALLELSERLAEFYRAAGNSLEQLYHLAVCNPPAAAQLLDKLFTAADGQFDLPQCSAILRTLEERPPRLLAPELVGPELREMLAAKRLRLDTRVLWAQEYRTTIPYVERNETQPLLEALLKDPQHWLLNLSAPGGMGKSMYIRAVVARHCALEGVPCAKIDFDFVPHLANVAVEPWRLLLRMAEQLNRQLRDSPFQELLTSYGQFGAESDSAVIISPREFVGSDLPPADKAALRTTVLSRFTDVLRAVDTPVLLIFDTLENLQHGNLDLEALYDLLLEVHARCANVRVILAGRLDLARPLPPAAGAAAAAAQGEETPFTRRLGGQNVAVALRGFDEDEARTYLDGRGLHDDPRAAVMIAKARIVDGDHGETGISPFKLALLADIVRVQPTITAADFERYEDVDLAYLIERVVDRIHDDQVKWLVRYGVVPRLLTRAIVKDVLVRFMLDGMRGQAQQDDATKDPAVEPQLSSPPFPVVKEGNLAVDPEALWQTLYRYTAEYSWVLADEAADALRFHQDVVEPMRRLLRKHLAAGRRILPDLHAACTAYYAERATADPEHRAQWLRESVYHKLQSGDPDADAYWLERVRAAGDDAVTVAALAEEAVLEPQIYDEVAHNEAEEMLRFGPGVRMQAQFLLASLLAHRAQPTADDWVKVRQRTAAAESLRAAAEADSAVAPPVAPGELDYLRARAALGLGNPQEARAVCELAMQSPATPANALDLQILEAEIMYALDLGAAPEHFARAAGLAAELQQARLGDIAPRWIEALDALERYEEAAGVCVRWRAEAGWRGTPDEVGSGLVLHMRQYLSMGQERRAAEVGREELAAWLAANGGQASALGAWPAYVEAEILLAGQQPAEALVRLQRELDPAAGTMSSGAPGGTGTGGFAQVLPAVEADLLARVYLALADALRARPLVEALAFTHYGPQTAAGFGWLAEFCRFHIDVTGDLRAAAEYLAYAQKGVADLVSDLRCRLLQIRLLARQGRHDDAAQAAAALAGRTDDLPPAPGLRLQIALERLLQTRSADAVQPLLAALEVVVPPSRRLLLLADLQRMPEPSRVPDASARTQLAILPLVPVMPDLDPAVGALRLAEVYGLQDSAAAVPLLDQAEAACREPLRLGVLREVYLARDRFGWQADDLRTSPLSDLVARLLPDPSGPAAANAELAGLALLEHAERTVRNLPDPQGAAALLDRAEVLLKGGAGLWTARILAVHARIAAAQRDPQVEKLVEQAAQAFHVLDDDVAADNLRTEIRALVAGPAASFAPDSLSFGLEALTPAQDPVAAPTEAAAPAEPKGLDGAPGSTPQLSIRLQQEGDHWLVEFEHSDGRRWKSAVPLEEDFATLLRPNPQEAVSSLFLAALQSDWQGLTLRMGEHLYPTSAASGADPEIRALLTGSSSSSPPLAVRLDIVPAELRWLPWELARLNDAAPPLPALPAVGVFYRSLRRARQAATGVAEPRRILLVQMAGAQSESGTRGSEQTAGGDVQRYYRRQGLDYEVLVQPSPDTLHGALLELRPTVVHLVSNLVEMGPQAALAFGRGRGAANTPAAKSATRSPYGEDRFTMLSAGDLGSLFTALEPSPLLVLDVPAPPVLAERLRQFCLRSAFTSDWAAHTQGTALLGVGLGTGDPQDQQTTQLVERLAAGASVGAIAQALRILPALRSDGRGYVRGTTGDGGFSPTLLPFAGVSLHTENPDQVFPVKRTRTR